MGGEPRLQLRKVLPHDAARSPEYLLAGRGFHRNGRETIGKHARRERRVVVAEPEIADRLRRCDRPSDPKARHRERLRQARGADDLVVAAPERR